MSEGRWRLARRLVRADNWWHHKVTIVLAFAYATLLGSSPEPPLDAGEAAVRLVVFLVAVIGVAGFGHVLNDAFDADQDRRAGRRTAVAEAPSRRRAVTLALLVVAALAPWAYLPTTPAVWLVLAAELLLLTAYSVPPVRLKERGVLGVLADASYAYVLPLLLTIAAFSAIDDRLGRDLTAVISVTAAWSFAVGVRSIVLHQLEDVDNDRRAGAETWTLRVGPPRALAVATTATVVEAVLLGVLVATLIDRVPLLPFLVVVAMLWRAFQLRALTGYGSDRGQTIPHGDAGEARLRWSALGLLNDVYERWLPIILLGTLVARDSAYAWILVPHLILFRNGVRDFVLRDLRALVALRFTFAYWSTYWRRRRAARRAEQRRAREGPSSSVPAGAGRFVYVVCGPAEHIHTLHTSLRHLAGRTRQEVVVVTDPERNELPIAHDHVIEVATPPELDDHQASIWIKTSLPRHVPLDTPACYLDSDIIAIDPRIDEIFEQYVPPITFAPDLTIRENCVDRFSPWAMNCGDDGLTTDTCSHLREALSDRFGVDVPGDWVHWNGGVFLFDSRSCVFLDRWHELVHEAFADPRFKTRDQHALIANVWQSGLAGHPTLGSEWNMIVDLGNYNISWYGGGRYGLDPADPPVEARLLHLYSNDLADEDFDLDRDVHQVVLHQMAQRGADRTRFLRAAAEQAAQWSAARANHWWIRALQAAVRGFRNTGLAARRAGWAFLDRVVFPVVNVGRRAGRSIARRARVAVGAETSPGGRADALRPPKLERRRSGQPN